MGCIEFILHDGEPLLVNPEMIVDVTRVNGVDMDQCFLQTVRDTWIVKGSYESIKKKLNEKVKGS